MYEEYLPEVQAAFAQRYRMIPCLCSLMHEAAVPGVPGRQEVLQRQAPGFHARPGGAGGERCRERRHGEPRLHHRCRERGVRTVFYDDDGHTKDFEKGVYARTEISVKEGERKVISFHRTGSYEQTLERLTLKAVSTGKSGLIVMAEDE